MKALMGKKTRRASSEPGDTTETMDLASIMELKRQTAWDEDADAPVKDEKSNRFWSANNSRRSSNPSNRASLSESAKNLLDDQSVYKEGHVEYQGESIPKPNLAYDKNPSMLVLEQIPDKERPLTATAGGPVSPHAPVSSNTQLGSNASALSPMSTVNRDPVAASRSIFSGSSARKRPPLVASVKDSPHVPTPSPSSRNTSMLSPTSNETLDPLGESGSTYHGSFALSPEGTKQRKCKMEKIRELVYENRELKATSLRMQQELEEKEARLRQMDGDGGQHFSGEGTRELPEKQEKYIEALLALTATTKKQQESISAHQARYDQLKKEFVRNQKETKQLMKAIAQKKKEALTLDKEIDANLLEITALRKELSSALQTIEVLEEKQKVDRAKLLNFAKRLAFTKAGMSGASDDIKAIAEEIQNYDEEIEEKKDEIEALRAEVANQVEEIKQLQLDLQRTQEQVEEYEKERDATMADMETYYEALKHELEEKNRLLDAVEQEKLDLASETTETVRTHELSTDLLEAHRDLAAMKHDRDRQLEQSSGQNEFGEEPERLSANLEAMSTQFDAMKEQYEELELEHTSAYQALEQEVGDLRIQLTEFKAALREATVRNRALTEKNEMLKTENSSLMDISQDLQQKLRQEKEKDAVSSAVLAGHALAASSQTRREAEEKSSKHAPVSDTVADSSDVEELQKMNTELQNEVNQMRELKVEAESSDVSTARSIDDDRVTESDLSLSGLRGLYPVREHTEVGSLDTGLKKEAGSSTANKNALSPGEKISDSSSNTCSSDDAVADELPSPKADPAGQQALLLQAAADRQRQRKISEKNMDRNWVSMKLFSNPSSSLPPVRDRSISSLPPKQDSSNNSLPPLAGGDNSSIDSSDVDYLDKDQISERMEKANQAHQQTIKDLKSEMIRMNASYKDEAYLNKKKIESLTLENSAYEIKLAVLEKMLEKLGCPVDSYSSNAVRESGSTATPAATTSAEKEAPQRDWSSPPKFHDRIKELEEQVVSLERQKQDAVAKMQAVESDLESFQRTTKLSAIASLREIERLQDENAEYERKLAELVKIGLDATEGNASRRELF